MEKAIEIIGLTKAFNKGSRLPRPWNGKNDSRQVVRAVDGITLDVERGKIFGLLGPNGAGKTTLIKLLCTLIVPTQGKALVNGHDIQKQGDQVRGTVGLVTTDERSFYWRLSGRENLLFFATLHNLAPAPARRRIATVLEQVGLTDKADSRFQTYSTGMKQRLALARGLLHDPPLLFLDEPTRGLDPLSAIHFRDLLADEFVKKQGKTILLTTHQLDEAARLCDHLAIMNHGKIRAQGTIQELTRLFAHATSYTAHISGITQPQALHLCSESVKQMGEQEDGRLRFHVTSRESGDELAQFIERVVMAGGHIRDVEKTEMPLEKLFERVLGEA